MKKILSTALVVILSISVFSGCGNKNAAKNDNDEIVIKWMPQNDGPVKENSPFIKKIEEKFGVKLDFIYIDRNKEKELLNVRIASGEIPDVMRRSDSEYRTFINQGILSEIPIDLIKKKAPSVYEATEKYGGEKIWNYPLDKGKNYGIPLINLNGSYQAIPVWRDDWLRNVGIDKIPETLEEAEIAFYKFTTGDPDGNGQKDTYAMADNGIKEIFCAYGVFPNNSYASATVNLFWSLNDEGRVVLSASRPEAKEALIKLAQYYKDGLIDPEFITGENKGKHFSESVPLWNGKIGFTVPGMFYHHIPPLTENSKGSNNYKYFKEIQGENASYTQGKPLVGPTGKFGGERWGAFSGTYIVCGKNVETGSKKMEKILEINEALASDKDFYTFVNWGEKDVNYKVADGEYISISETQERTELGISVHGIGYMANNFDFVKTQSNIKQYEYADKYANYSEDYTNAVWGGLPSDSKYKSIVQKKIDEAYILFITGKKPVSEFDSFVAELNQVGLKTLEDEANEWYKTVILGQ